MRITRIFRIAHSLTALSICLCMAVIISLLGGCKNQSKPSGGTDSNPSSSGGNAQSVKSALKMGVNENLDLQKKTLSISVWGEPTPEGMDTYMDRRYTLERRTEERYNVNIEWVTTNIETFVQDVTLAFTAGKKFADLIFAPSYYGFDLCKLGAVIPLDDYIDYSSPFYAVTGNNLLYVDGKHYSYMPDEYSANNVGFFITYNQTLLEQAGCEDPMELYQQGKWDWAAFEEIARKTTVIKDGEIKQWGIGGSNLLDALCLSNGFSLISMDTNNKQFTCNLHTDEGLNVLNFLKKLTFDYKACDGNYGGHNSMLTFGDSKTAMIICPSYYPNKFITSGMPVAAVPMPKGPNAKGYVNGQEMQEWWMVSAISDFDYKDLLQVALDMNDNDPAYADTYFSAEGMKQNFITRCYDGCVFATEEEAEFFYDYIRDEKVEKMLNITTTSIKNVLTENIFRPISSGEEPRTVLERVKPVINEVLKEMLPDKMK